MGREGDRYYTRAHTDLRTRWPPPCGPGPKAKSPPAAGGSTPPRAAVQAPPWKQDTKGRAYERKFANSRPVNRFFRYVELSTVRPQTRRKGRAYERKFANSRPVNSLFRYVELSTVRHLPPIVCVDEMARMAATRVRVSSQGRSIIRCGRIATPATTVDTLQALSTHCGCSSSETRECIRAE